MRYFSKILNFINRHAIAFAVILAVCGCMALYSAKANADVTITSQSVYRYDSFVTYVLGITADSTGTVAFPDSINGLLDNIIIKPGATSPSANTTVKLYDPYVTTQDWLGDAGTLATTTGPLRTQPYTNSQYGAILVTGIPTISVGSNTNASADMILVIRTIQKKVK